MSNYSCIDRIKMGYTLLLFQNPIHTMKRVSLLIFLFWLSDHLWATTYYFSSAGNDSFSSIQAQNPASPWRSLAKLNSIFSTLQPGDSILFKRNEVFDGSIRVNNSGTASAKIYFGAFGTGAHPIITGFQSITGWTNYGSGIWQADCVACGINLNTVTINGAMKALGRTPNITDPNRGYLKFESHAGNTQITDNELSANPNWNGAEIVIRKNYWTLDRNLVTTHSGNTVSFISPTGHPLIDNYGYFFQKSLQTLDQNGEWYYNTTTRKLYIHFGAAGPGTSIVKAGIVDTLVTISNRSNLIFENLQFEGSDTTAFAINNAQNIQLNNCILQLSGIDAINARNSEKINIQNCTILHTNNNAVRITDCNHSLVANNTITNTGLFPGMGLSNNQMYEAIYTRGTANTIQQNEVINTGYSAITFAGDSALVKNNFVNNYTMVLDDGGGIYGWGDYNKFGRKIIGNIILNGIGAPEGTDVAVAGNSSGIYLDDRSANVEITGNTIAAANRSGIYLHNSHEIQLSSNTLYNNTTQVSMVHDDLEPADPIRNVQMQDNIFFSKTANQLSTNSSSRLDDIQSFGTYNYNYYVRPLNEHGIIQTDHKDASGTYIRQLYSLDSWKARFNKDQNSYISPIPIPAHLVYSVTGLNKCSNGNFNSNINGAFGMASPVACITSWNSGGRLDGGALEVRSAGAATNINTHINFGPVEAGKKYRIRFSLLGSNPFETIGAYILKNAAPYNRLCETTYFSVKSSRTENEFLFVAPSTESSLLLILTINNSQLPFWIDNVEILEANAIVTNPDDHFRFEYNKTASPVTVPLDAIYLDARNNYFSDNIVLAPFSGAVLIRSNSLLPANFTTFTITEHGNSTLFRWAMNGNNEIAHYIVEVAEDGRSFVAVDTISSNRAASFMIYASNSSKIFSPGTCVRIRAIKMNAGSLISKVICIGNKTQSSISLFPNPTTGNIQLITPITQTSTEASLKVNNYLGATVYSSRPIFIDGKTKLDLSTLPAGIYFLTVEHEGSVFNYRFVKK